MLKITMAMGVLIGIVGGAFAAPWSGAEKSSPTQRLFVLAACGYNDQHCPAGRRFVCRPDGPCFCASCRPRYYEEPRYYEQPRNDLVIPFNFGGGGDDRRYNPPVNGRCPRNYTIQDGLCKPYRGY